MTKKESAKRGYMTKEEIRAFMNNPKHRPLFQIMEKKAQLLNEKTRKNAYNVLAEDADETSQKHPLPVHGGEEYWQKAGEDDRAKLSRERYKSRCLKAAEELEDSIKRNKPYNLGGLYFRNDIVGITTCAALYRDAGDLNHEYEVLLRAEEKAKDNYRARKNEPESLFPTIFKKSDLSQEKRRLERIQERIKELKKERGQGDLSSKISMVIGGIGLIAGIFFLSSNITGNVIGNSTTSNILGVVLLLIGIVGAFFYFKSRR